MYWDGTHWIHDPLPTGGRRRPRLRDLLATGIVALGLVALTIPIAGTAAATYPGDALIATWKSTHVTNAYQETSSRIRYSGWWSLQRHSSHMRGAIKSTRQRSARVTFTFTGSAVAWVGPRRLDRGKAKVYVDGRYIKTVDTYASTLRPRQVLFTRTWTRAGKHTLTIVALGTAGRPRVSVDALVVRGAKLSTATSASCGSSLQAKIDAAPSGGRLDLTGCTYTTGARVGKPLTLVGARVAIAARGATALHVTASNVTLDGLTITGGSVAKYGILAHRVQNLVVRRSTITDIEYGGIMALSVSGGTIAGNHVARIGTRLSNGDNAYGIALSNYDGQPVTTDVTVDRNVVEDVPTWHGLDTHAGRRLAFTNNVVRRVSRALFLTSGASSITVTGNQLLSPDPVTYNLSAITLVRTDRVTISGNAWSRDWDGRYINDYGDDSTNLVVSNNTVVP